MLQLQLSSTIHSVKYSGSLTFPAPSQWANSEIWVSLSWKPVGELNTLLQ